MSGKAILLVEDDFLNRRLTKKALIENGFKVFEAKNAKEAFGILKRETLDVVILDINLGKDEENGISIAQQLKANFNIPFIYLTAYDKSDIIKEAVATVPHSYITKPFKDVDLVIAVELAIKQYGKSSFPKITVKDEDYNVELDFDEINYIESDGNYQVFHTDTKKYRLRGTSKHLLDLLPADKFVQVHRAYIVNKGKIEKFNLKNVIVNSIEIPISKKKPLQ